MLWAATWRTDCVSSRAKKNCCLLLKDFGNDSYFSGSLEIIPADRTCRSALLWGESRVSDGEAERWHTATPRSAPSLLIHPAPSRRLGPLFSHLQSAALPLPLGRSCPSLVHTDIQTLFRDIMPPRSALNLHFTASGCSFLSRVPFSLFSPSLLLMYLVEGCTGCSELLISRIFWCHYMCWKKRK